MSLVTVVIPCYNCEKWIDRAVSSVLAQTYSNIEIILVNNNSTDNTPKLLEEYQNSYPDKIRVFSEKKKGAPAARNLGLFEARGEWIQFLDADDELLPEKIESQMAFVKSEKPDLIVDDYRKIHKHRKELPIENVEANNDRWLGLINSRLGITSANLWRKERLVKINGWKEGLISSQEYEMLFRLLKTNPKIVYNHKINTLIHAQTESISRTGSSDKAFKLICNRYYLRRDIYDYLDVNKMLNDTYKESLLLYLYYHLLLISEFDKALFEEECKRFDFKQISYKNKYNIYCEFIRHSSKRKYAYSNIVIKGLEWYAYFFKNLALMKY